MPLPTLNGEYVNKPVVQKTIHTQNIHLYCFKTLCKWPTGYIQKNIVANKSLKICDFFGHTIRLLGFCFVNVYTFKRDLLARVSFLYGLNQLIGQ